VGTFDGIHLGHQEILRCVRDTSRATRLDPVLVTFHPHPRVLTSPDNVPLLLTTIEEKERFIPDFFDGTVLVLNFDEALMNLEPEEFVKEILVKKVGVRRLIVGYDHALGKNRRGTIAELKKYGNTYGYEVEVCGPIMVDDAPVSSSRIRRAMIHKRYPEALRLLGHEYAIFGAVEKGIGLGKKLGYPSGIYRVGPLGRLNVADGCDTPLANEEFHNFKKLGNDGVVQQSLYYHYARLIEMLNAAEKIKLLAQNELICSKEIWVNSSRINEEGIGVIEAPRGTLIHHYWVDASGKIGKVNLIVATGHNNLAMNRAVYEVAREFIKNGKVTEGILNRVEVAIRCYDPCLSCSTHALGHMPLEITIYKPDGNIRQVLRS